MNCPTCKKEMVVRKEDISNNFDNGKEYKRSSYWCKTDDVWVLVEAPVRAD